MAMLMTTDAHGRAMYVYDAFIGYARVSGDRRWAEWLANVLENCSVPEGLGAKALPPLRRAFRDKNEQSEAKLQDDVRDALKASRFLVIVCSPSTPGDKRIAQQIEHFHQLGRGDHVLAVLSEGDLSDALPPILFERQRSRQAGDVDVIGEGPLVADVRPRSGLSRAKIQHRALLGLTARILEVSSADLRQAVKAQRRRLSARRLARPRRF
jgi:hypothetical protein